MITLDYTDDLFRTYTLPYEKSFESTEKCQKVSVLVENRIFKIPMSHHPLEVQ